MYSELPSNRREHLESKSKEMFLIELGLIKISRVPSIVEVQYPEVVGCMVKCLRNGCCESADDGDVQKIMRMMEGVRQIKIHSPNHVTFAYCFFTIYLLMLAESAAFLEACFI